jgi:hypothetical protein
MKHLEFYNKYKTTYTPIVNPIFSKRNWWYIVVITVAAVLIEPLLFMSKYKRSVPFSFSYYVELIEYFFLIAIPFIALLIWINMRESTKRSRGYGWVGKFEVIKKKSLFLFRYLLLAPGNGNKIRVSRNLFDKTRVGDFILVRRDALGGVEEVSKTKNFSGRLARRLTKPSENLFPTKDLI